jgi:tyrosinase
VAYVRRDIWALSHEDTWHPVIEWYARAIVVLKQRDGRDLADPRSWGHLAAIHGTKVPLGRRPAGALWDQCEHNSWFFLPWHRAYLHHFEKIVRAAVVDAGGPADWALPYWEYSDPGRPETRTLPPAFREEFLPSRESSREANPLLIKDRGPRMNLDGKLDDTAVSIHDAWGQTGFTETTGGGASGGFGGAIAARLAGQTPGALEMTPHGSVHMGVGGSNPRGWMSDFNKAGLDPIFWLHHANIDRRWAGWLTNARSNPTQREWLQERFVFGSGAWRTDLATEDMLDTTQAPLSYSFDQLPESPVDPGGAPARRTITTEGRMRDGAPKVAGTSDAEVPLTDTVSRTEVRVTAPPDQGLEGVAAEEAGRVFLKLEGVRGEKLAAGVFEVYVNLPEGAKPQEFRDHRAGQISMFGVVESSQAETPHGGGGLNFSFDITNLVQRLQAKGHWRPASVHVAFAPIPDSAGKVHPGADVSVRRVTVYYV